MIDEALWGLHASRVDGQLVIDRADKFATISREMWAMAVRGEACPGVLAGEGILVIRASNGTYRYDLTGERNERGDWYMRRVSIT